MKSYHVAIDYSHRGWPATGAGSAQGVWYGHVEAESSKQAIAKAVSQLETEKPMLKVKSSSATLSGWNR